MNDSSYLYWKVFPQSCAEFIHFSSYQTVRNLQLCNFSIYFDWFITDPETEKFLSEKEREAILDDLPEQAPTMKAETFNLGQVKDLFKNPTFIPFLMIWITHGIGGWGISFVLPTVIYELGISNTAISQVMTMVSYELPANRAGGVNTEKIASIYTCFCDSSHYCVLHPYATT
jgi:hypothetical protein